MKKLLLATLGISTSLLAITQEQQTKIDELFNQKEQNISQSTEFGAGEKQMLIQTLKEEKAKVEKMSDEEIEEYLDEEATIAKNKKDGFDPENYRFRKNEEWIGWLAGAVGATTSGFFTTSVSKSSAMAYYLTFGPKYNITYNGFFAGTIKGFSISLPIGIGGLNFAKESQGSFALPIALEASYMFSNKRGFGLKAGARYTFSAHKNGNLHIIDCYAGMDLFYGVFIEAGYVLYSSQDVKVGNKTKSIDPLSSAISFNAGWRF